MEYENKFVGLSSVMSHDLEILRYELEYGWKLALIPNDVWYNQLLLKFQIMAYYKVSVDVSDLFDDMLVHAQKSFLIDKFCSLATDQQIEVVSEMLENLNGDQVAKVIEDAFDNLHEQGQEQVINYVNE